jgi:hypothetical protein
VGSKSPDGLAENPMKAVPDRLYLKSFGSKTLPISGSLRGWLIYV